MRIATYNVNGGKVYSGLLSDAAQQVLREPIRADEIPALRKMAAAKRRPGEQAHTIMNCVGRSAFAAFLPEAVVPRTAPFLPLVGL